MAATVASLALMARFSARFARHVGFFDFAPAAPWHHKLTVAGGTPCLRPAPPCPSSSMSPSTASRCSLVYVRRDRFVLVLIATVGLHSSREPTPVRPGFQASAHVADVG